jgi:preprotein translocase subunit SecA
MPCRAVRLPVPVVPQAYELYVNGKDYIVRDGEAVIVDPSTGRLRPQTRWQGGIHQVGGWGWG